MVYSQFVTVKNLEVLDLTIIYTILACMNAAVMLYILKQRIDQLERANLKQVYGGEFIAFLIGRVLTVDTLNLLNNLPSKIMYFIVSSYLTMSCFDHK